MLVLPGSYLWVWLGYLLLGLWSQKYINNYVTAMKQLGPWAKRSGSFRVLSLRIVYSMTLERRSGITQASGSWKSG